jgi:hypothetical protein
VILNDEIHKRRVLTAENDIRDVGFLIWQIARSRIIVFDSGRQTDSAAALTGGDGVGESHLVAECDVAARMIVHRGMRGWQICPSLSLSLGYAHLPLNLPLNQIQSWYWYQNLSYTHFREQGPLNPHADTAFKVGP